MEHQKIIDTVETYQEVIFTPKCHIDMQIGVFQEGQFVQKLQKETNMTRVLKNLISTHTREYLTQHMREIHKRRKLRYLLSIEMLILKGALIGCMRWRLSWRS
jgi:hypothetical protein